MSLPRRRLLRESTGTGTLSAAIGITVALTMLLGTVQLLARLHRTTIATALANDAARAVAEAPPGTGPAHARDGAERRIRALLGPEAVVRWRLEHEIVHLDIHIPSPRVPGLSPEIHRGVDVRREGFP